MSSDGFFWAGMAGGRMERINKLNHNIRTWKEHSAKLERITAVLILPF